MPYYDTRRPEVKAYLDRKMRDVIRLHNHGLRPRAIAAVIDHSDELTLALLMRAVGFGLLRNQPEA